MSISDIRVQRGIEQPGGAYTLHVNKLFCDAPELMYENGFWIYSVEDDEQHLSSWFRRKGCTFESSARLEMLQAAFWGSQCLLHLYISTDNRSSCLNRQHYCSASARLCAQRLPHYYDYLLSPTEYQQSKKSICWTYSTINLETLLRNAALKSAYIRGTSTQKLNQSDWLHKPAWLRQRADWPVLKLIRPGIEVLR